MAQPLPAVLARVNIWLVGGASLAMLAWLLPNHAPPWPAFYNEWVAALALAALCTWLPLRWRQPLEVPAAAIALAAVAAIPMAQAAAGTIEQVGDAAIAASLLVGTALATVLGRYWGRHAGDEARCTLWGLLLAAALLSAGAALAQWLRLEDFGVLLADLPFGARSAGNIAQANHLGTLLIWGLVGLWWLAIQCQVRASIALPAAALLLLAAATTQSRTVWLNLALMAIAAVIWRRHLVPRRGIAISLAALLTGFAWVVLGWPTLNAALHLQAALAPEAALEVGARSSIWRLGLAAVQDAPAFGFGWTQVNQAQQAMALDVPAVQRNISYAHNLGLDLMIWSGPLPGSLLLLMLLGWVARQFRRVRDANDAVLALGVLAVLAHAQLEMPHSYAYFMLPAGLMAGMLRAAPGSLARTPKDPWALHWRVALAVALVSVALLAILLRDYRVIELRLHQERFRAARVGPDPGPPPPSPWLLTQFEVLWPAMRVRPEDARGAATQQILAAAARRFASAPLQWKLALAQARNGDPHAARQTLARMCAMQRQARCALMIAGWSELARGEPALRAVPLPTIAASAMAPTRAIAVQPTPAR